MTIPLGPPYPSDSDHASGLIPPSDWQPSESEMLPPRPEVIKAVTDLGIYQTMFIADMRRSDQQERYYSAGELQQAAGMTVRYETDELG